MSESLRNFSRVVKKYFENSSSNSDDTEEDIEQITGETFNSLKSELIEELKDEHPLHIKKRLEQYRIPIELGSKQLMVLKKRFAKSIQRLEKDTAYAKRLYTEIGPFIKDIEDPEDLVDVLLPYAHDEDLLDDALFAWFDLSKNPLAPLAGMESQSRDKVFQKIADDNARKIYDKLYHLHMLFNWITVNDTVYRYSGPFSMQWRDAVRHSYEDFDGATETEILGQVKVNLLLFAAIQRMQEAAKLLMTTSKLRPSILSTVSNCTKDAYSLITIWMGMFKKKSIDECDHKIEDYWMKQLRRLQETHSWVVTPNYRDRQFIKNLHQLTFKKTFIRDTYEIMEKIFKKRNYNYTFKELQHMRESLAQNLKKATDHLSTLYPKGARLSKNDSDLWNNICYMICCCAHLHELTADDFDYLGTAGYIEQITKRGSVRPHPDDPGYGQWL